MSDIETTQIDAVTAFARNGVHLYSARSSGLYHSDDDGQSWVCMTHAVQTGGSPVTAIAVSEDTLFVGLNGAILHTVDRGQNWEVIPLAVPPPLVSALVLSPHYVEDGTAFAGTAEDGVFVTTDYGQRWVPWNFGLIDLDIYCLALTSDFVLYAGTETGIFCSRNSGKSWEDIPFPMDMAPVLNIVVTPDGKLFAGTDGHGLFLSDDKGQTWTRLLQSSELETDIIHSVQVYADALIVLTDTHLLQLQTGDLSYRVLKQFADEQVLSLGMSDTHWFVGYIDGHIDRIPRA